MSDWRTHFTGLIEARGWTVESFHYDPAFGYTILVRSSAPDGEPLAVLAREGVILDGHHRVAAAAELGVDIAVSDEREYDGPHTGVRAWIAALPDRSNA